MESQKISNVKDVQKWNEYSWYYNVKVLSEILKNPLKHHKFCNLKVFPLSTILLLYYSVIHINKKYTLTCQGIIILNPDGVFFCFFLKNMI